MNPLVSVIIPAYNREKYLAETIQSVLSQDYSSLEILVVDDGSTDNTLQVANHFRNKGVRVFAGIHQGASAARNKGIGEAKGDYIQFLDSDDLLNPEKISKQVALLRDRQGYLATCSTVHFYQDENHLDKQSSAYEDRFLHSNDNPVEFLVKLWGGYDEHGSMVSSNAWLVPRSVVEMAGLWDENLSADDDGEYFTRVVLNSSGIVYSKTSLNYYRKYRGNSLSDVNSEGKFQSILASALSKKKQLFAKTNSENAKLAIHKMLMNIAVSSYPMYPAIYRVALNELPATRLPFHLHVGSPLTNRISKLFGWKVARMLHHLKRKII